VERVIGFDSADFRVRITFGHGDNIGSSHVGGDQPKMGITGLIWRDWCLWRWFGILFRFVLFCFLDSVLVLTEFRGFGF
jgi:hypothetical protein